MMIYEIAKSFPGSTEKYPYPDFDPNPVMVIIELRKKGKIKKSQLKKYLEKW